MGLCTPTSRRPPGVSRCSRIRRVHSHVRKIQEKLLRLAAPSCMGTDTNACPTYLATTTSCFKRLPLGAPGRPCIHPTTARSTTLAVYYRNFSPTIYPSVSRAHPARFNHSAAVVTSMTAAKASRINQILWSASRAFSCRWISLAPAMVAGCFWRNLRYDT